MEMPEPRVALGMALRGIASSAIDLSDGLVGDLGHLMSRSQLAARVNVDALPRSELLAGLPAPLQHEFVLRGGDDYELLFSAPRERHDAVRAAAGTAGVLVSAVGHFEPGSQLVLIDAAGQVLDAPGQGFDHFKS
jgi:thiamine-monophosphate kinase